MSFEPASQHLDAHLFADYTAKGYPMRIDVLLGQVPLAEIAALARSAERLGFDGLWTMESQHDPFIPLTLASQTTSRITLGTAIAVAFARSPTITAHTSWDLQALTRGRFILGLGTQVRGHIERRFGLKWESPGPKLREYILALRAIWDCWQHGTPLSYTGKFYHLTLMTPFFSPDVSDYSRPPIYIAGVNPYICRLAGELCDGFHVHPLHSVKYLREIVIPHIEEGARKAGRHRSAVTLFAPVFVVTGENQQEMQAAKAAAKQQIAFYASTRNYRPVLDIHGWGEIGPILTQKAAAGDWQGMAGEITDAMLEEFAVVGPQDEIAACLKARYSGLLDRLAFYHGYQPGTRGPFWRKVIAALHA
jgi:probable F420-dependent oxidoreductase